MIPGMVRHAGFRQATARNDKTVDPPSRTLVPLNIERTKPRKKLQMRIGQVVVNPPCQRSPVGAVRVSVGVPRNHDTGRGAHEAVGVAPVPDVARVVFLVCGAIQPVPVTEFVERRRPVTASDIDPAKGPV